jgi:hypothetical protein
VANNAYVLFSEWQVPGNVQAVYEVVSDADGLARIIHESVLIHEILYLCVSC